MIVNDLDIKSITVRKLEAKAPTPIDRHRPLVPPPSLQLVKPNASQIAQLGKVRRRVEGSQ
jgi:hypothetical protein